MLVGEHPADNQSPRATLHKWLRRVERPLSEITKPKRKKEQNVTKQKKVLLFNREFDVSS